MILFNRIRLRAIEVEDRVIYHKWINDSETNFWRGLYHPMSLAEVTERLEELKRPSSEQISLVIEAENSEPIGLVGLRNICLRSRRAEIWIYIGEKKYWNQKFGQEALSALIKYAFDEMNLHRVWLECDPDFKLSVKCYEHVGFCIEGRLKDGYFRHGKYRDTIVMGIVNTN